MKKIISAVIALTLLFTAFPDFSLAADESENVSKTKTVTISDTALHLVDMDSQKSINSISGLAAEKKTKLDNFKYSGKWEVSAMKNISFPFPKNTKLSDYSEIRFWAYSDSKQPFPAMLILWSDNPETDGSDYYFKDFNFNWDGWKEVVISLESLKQGRTPLGFDTITSAQIFTSGWNMKENPSACTYIGDITLDTQLKPVPTPTPVSKEDVLDGVYLYINCPNALVNGSKISVDKNNQDVVPFIKDSRTLVPVRFISESFGAKVEYDEASKNITIKNGSDKIDLTVGSNILTKNGVQTTLDVTADVYDGRTFVPLRACAESLGKEVFYDSMGLICISDEKDRFDSDRDFQTLLGLALDMICERPSGEQMAEDISKIHPANSHPRLKVSENDFAEIREKAKTDKFLQDTISKLQAKADKTLDTEPYSYVLQQRRLLGVTTAMQNIIESNAFMYNITNDKKYADRAWKEMKAASEFKDWHPEHYLDTAALAMGMSIGYDWLYDYLADLQKKTCEEAIFKFSITTALEAHAGTGIPGDGWGDGGRNTWYQAKSNWNGVCNAGAMASAIALLDVYPNECKDLMGKTIIAFENGMLDYAPDGGYSEGPGYWSYGTNNVVNFISILESAAGTNYGLFNVPGFSQTPYYAYYTEGTKSMWNFHDTAESVCATPTMFWFAKKLSDSNLATIRYNRVVSGKENADSNDVLFYSKDLVKNEIQLELDKYYTGIDTITMRGDWNDENTVVAGLHGGKNTANHGNLDIGNFIVEALGERWINDLGNDSYDLPAYFTSGVGGGRWNYYRQRAEGQNTLVINPTADADQLIRARGRITRFESKPRGAIAAVDLSEAYGTKIKDGQAQRTLMLTNNRQSVVVQDEVTLSKPGEIYWFAHTPAKIQLADDSRSAILSIGAKKLHVQIVSENADAKFTVMDADPLPSSPAKNPIEYGRGTKKLAIHLKNVSEFNTAVVFNAVTSGDMPEYSYTYTKAENWTIPDGNLLLPSAEALLINGEKIEEFNPKTTLYSRKLEFGTTICPEISAEYDSEKYTMTITKPSVLPGSAVVKLVDKTDSSMYTNYVIAFDVAKEIEITASDAPEAANPPQNAFDGNLETKWAANGKQWIKFEFAKPKEIKEVGIAVMNGTVRKYTFEITVSTDGENFESVYSSQTSGTTDEIEYYPINKTNVKAVKINFSGNTVNSWNSITEVTFR